MSGVAVVVLGDLARSPRMLNHASALVEAGHEVMLIGYVERELELPKEIRLQALHPMRRAKENAGATLFLLVSALRMGTLFFELTAALWRSGVNYILVQNPPSFPTLTAAWVAARLTGAKLIADWHNYGYSLVALRVGRSHRFVRMAAWYERVAGRMADAHLCVSEAMRKDLAVQFGIAATVLYDRPLRAAAGDPDRAIAICPAGWTADEDIGMLLDAMEKADGRCHLKLHLTGDGPMRQEFESRIRGMQLRTIGIQTGFLPWSEYRALVRKASFGISLHRSSSGLDLAMKVVDLFEARVPVCAFDYGGALPEQVKPCVTGMLFRNAGELAEQVVALAAGEGKLAEMRANIDREWKESWTEAWQRQAGPIFKR